MSTEHNKPISQLTSLELAERMEKVNAIRESGKVKKEIDIQLDKLELSQTDEELSNVKFQLSSKHWQYIIGILTTLILISIVSIFIPSGNNENTNSKNTINDIIYPTAVPRNITLPNFHETKTYTLNRIFGDLPNFSWTTTGTYTGLTYLAIQDPAARQNPAIPYYVEINNAKGTSLFKFNSPDCIQCLLSDVTLTGNGSYTVVIENNGIYNYERGAGLLSKLSVPDIKHPIQQIGNILVYTTGTEIVEIDNTGELLWSWSVGDVVNELTTIPDLLENFRIIQVQRLGSNQYFALIEDTKSGIKLLVQIDKETKQITRKILDNFGGLIINNPISFLITSSNKILIYDANNVVYTSTLGRMNPFLIQAKIQSFTLQGEIESGVVILQIDNINLGPSLNSQIQLANNGDLLIIDPTNNRVSYLDPVSLEPKFTIQGEGHIINGASFVRD